MEKQRDSNFELCRIILILLIIMHHYLVIGGAISLTEIGEKNYYLSNFLFASSAMAVNCFILISGYYGIKFKLRRLISLEMEILFYSILIFFIFYKLRIIYDGCNLVTYEGSMRKALKATIFPVLSGPQYRWWFFSVYMGLYILAPYINIVLNQLDKKQFIVLLGILASFFCIMPTLGFQVFSTKNGFSLYQFIMLYIMGAGIRKYGNLKWIEKYGALCYIGSNLIMLLTGWGIRSNGMVMVKYDNILCILSALAFFSFFKKLHFSSRIINGIALCVPGIYLLHDHPYVRHYIYENIFRVPEFCQSNFFGIKLVIDVFIIFLICAIIEGIRQLLISKMIPIYMRKLKIGWLKRGNKR